MKVLLMNKFHYILGGSETCYFALADLLRSMNREVVFFSMRDDRNFPYAQAEYFTPNVGYTGDQPLYTQLSFWIETDLFPERRTPPAKAA